MDRTPPSARTDRPASAERDPMPRAATAAALVVGNEILSGKVEEANLVVLARFLRAHGIELQRAEFVLDDVAAIAEATRTLAARHDWVFTSGGVGPTHDDVTVEAVAKAFGVPVVSHPGLRSMLEGHYGDRINEGHLRMALIPEGAELESTAEVRWPVVRFANVWMLPGIPEIFQMKLAVLAASLPRGVAYVSHAVYSRLEESDIKPLLDAVVEAFPDVFVGSYPKWTTELGYRTKLTFDGREEARVLAARDAFTTSLPPGEPARVE
jgi:molybdenum cofactor synthesis domain-containing protein